MSLHSQMQVFLWIDCFVSRARNCISVLHLYFEPRVSDFGWRLEDLKVVALWWGGRSHKAASLGLVFRLLLARASARTVRLADPELVLLPWKPEGYVSNAVERDGY